jgi:hypothetical protein
MMTMMQQQFALLSPLITIFVLLAVLILYVYYSTDKLYRIKLLLGPALLLACAGAFPYVGVKLGYGWPAALPESFEYMAHKAIVVSHEKRWLDVLVVSRKPYKADPRLHRVPWSQKFEDALDKAQAMKEGKEGGNIVMDSGGGESPVGDAYPDYVPKRVLPQQQNPKAKLLPRESPGQQPREAPADRQRQEPRLSV